MLRNTHHLESAHSSGGAKLQYYRLAAPAASMRRDLLARLATEENLRVT
jgi:hypothetical protein